MAAEDERVDRCRSEQLESIRRGVHHGTSRGVEARVDDDGEAGPALEVADHAGKSRLARLVDRLDAGRAVDVRDGRDAVDPLGSHPMDEEHVGIGIGPPVEDLVGPAHEHHQRDGPELLAALDGVEPLEVLGMAGMGQK